MKMNATRRVGNLCLNCGNSARLKIEYEMNISGTEGVAEIKDEEFLLPMSYTLFCPKCKNTMVDIHPDLIHAYKALTAKHYMVGTTSTSALGIINLDVRVPKGYESYIEAIANTYDRLNLYNIYIYVPRTSPAHKILIHQREMTPIVLEELDILVDEVPILPNIKTFE